MAVVRATRSERSISAPPSAALGRTVTSPACTARAAASASNGSDLPRPAAGGPVGSVDLQHDLACLVQEAGQGGPVAAGALDAEGLDVAESLCPGKQVLVARRRGRDADGAKTSAELVFGVGDVDVAVGVDPTVTRVASACAMVVMAISFSRVGMDGTPAGRADTTARGLRTQASIRSRLSGLAVPERRPRRRADRSDSRAQSQWTAGVRLMPRPPRRPSQWTLPRIAEVIWRTCGVSYHPGHVWWLLRRHDCQAKRIVFPGVGATERPGPQEHQIAIWCSQQ
jgi:Winged helix-turn helix